MSDRTYNLIAIDLGASNGRVVLGRLHGDHLDITVIHRFAHSPQRLDGRLRWDWETIWSGIRSGLRAAAEECGAAGVSSVSCSSWAQDFGLLDAEDRLFYPPVSYRDDRTRGMPGSFAEVITPEDLIRRCGSGVTPVTTLCQLRAMSCGEPEALLKARTLLFVADLVHFALCGAKATDRTMSTASQLRSLSKSDWDVELMQNLEIPHHFLPSVENAPRILGPIMDGSVHPRLEGVPVVSTAGHDTAAAAASLGPLEKGEFFLALGTWSMLGCCTEDLIIPSDAANTEVVVLGLPGSKWGVFKAGMGMWLLEECRRQWRARGVATSYEELVSEGERASIHSTVDPTQARFHYPADMLAEIEQSCAEHCMQIPRTPGEFARVIFETLACHHAAGLVRLERAVGIEARGLTVLCGGSRNVYLRRRIAELVDVPVTAGHAEATSIGNIMLQAKVLGLGHPRQISDRVGCL